MLVDLLGGGDVGVTEDLLDVFVGDTHVFQQGGGAVLWCAVLLAIAASVRLGADHAITVAGLVFAALTVFTPFLVQSPGTSLYSLPLLARLLPAITLISTSLMCVWLVFMSENHHSGFAQWVRYYGWPFSIGIMFGMTLLLFLRRRDLKAAYSAANEMRFMQNGTLYDSEGKEYNAKGKQTRKSRNK